MNKILSSQKGMVLLSIAVIVSILMTLGSLTMNRVLNYTKSSAKQEMDWRYDFYNKQASVLGGYLVANNLVLCRSKGWDSHPNKEKCRWGGDLHKPAIAPSAFQLSNPYFENGALKFELKLADLPAQFNQTLSFDLLSFLNEEGREFIGDIPEELHDVDSDYFFVSIKANIEDDEIGHEFVKKSGVRRPLSSLKVNSAGKGQCLLSCVSSVGQNPYPSCRGPQERPTESVTEVFLNVNNMGPGAVYDVQLTKRKTYNQSFYELPDETTLIDITQDLEVIMPGEKVQVADSVKCVAPRFISRTVQGGGSGTSVSVHSETLSTIRYDFDFKKYREYLLDPASWDPNEPLSYYEPARILTKVEEGFGQYRNTRNVHVTTTYVNYVHSH